MNREGAMYVKTTTLAEELGVTSQTIRNWGKKDPNFPQYNIGTESRPNWRYVIEEVKAYLEERSK